MPSAGTRFREERALNGALKALRKPQHYEPPEKKGEMYPMNWPGYDNNDVEKRISGVLGPLSLFAPFPHEDMKEEEPNIELERPVTPIDEEIKSQPMSFDKLAGYIRRRLSPRPDVPHLTFEDQQHLAGILMGEVTGVWPEIRKQIDDPFLSALENRELNRLLNSRGIFSGPANMSRLKAQLSLDANKFLNILMIRRYLVGDMRGGDDLDSQDSDFMYTPQLAGRPKSKLKRFRFKSPEHEARKIIANMPTLDMTKVSELVMDLPERELGTPSEVSEHPPSRLSDKESQSSGISKETVSKQRVLMKRSNSLPEFVGGETLMEELGISEDVRVDELERHEVRLLQEMNKRENQVKVEVAKKTPREEERREYISADLARLLGKAEEEVKADEDMPPLLQAITRSSKHDGMKASIPLREPKHAQPATVKTKMPNKMEVRASDVRVSERVCMSSITLDKYATVYNDLNDEIDAATVKQLDRNLFLGDEIREVYHEIMRTIPAQHLELDDDDNVVPCADSVNMTGTMASASLVRKRSDRVINPIFTKDQIKAPWGEMDPKQWVRTPNNPPKNFQGEDVFAPLDGIETPNMDKVHEVLRNPSKMSQLVTATEEFPSYVQDKVARTYASWLQWWKSTITSDDYLKYLSTQETDYMAAVFHFYDSGEDDDDEDDLAPTGLPATLGTTGHLSYLKPAVSRTTHTSKQTELKEKEKKLEKIEEMKVQKSEYQEGFWNVNSVLMGGLGKEPVIEEEEEESKEKPRSADTQRSAKTLQERAAARHSAKMDKPRQDITMSRASKVTTLTSASKMETDRSSVSEVEAPPTPQERLEKVWTNLEMPDGLKLDMAIKYSCNEFFMKLAQAIELWEAVTSKILRREELLVKLEKFERTKEKLCPKTERSTTKKLLLQGSPVHGQDEMGSYRDASLAAGRKETERHPVRGPDKKHTVKTCTIRTYSITFCTKSSIEIRKIYHET
ncbi:CCD87-like protein [Mya arenaria]|uniref:CCD87-like protein n=1 Tax=Mya arenaria TaxID=6604 RepID=A0ABY7DN48_MYAAR|nr:CCD87-like protein [Mya arenaria]